MGKAEGPLVAVEIRQIGSGAPPCGRCGAPSKYLTIATDFPARGSQSLFFACKTCQALAIARADAFVAAMGPLPMPIGENIRTLHATTPDVPSEEGHP